MSVSQQQELTAVEGDLENDKQDVLNLWWDGLTHPDPEKSFDWLFVDNPYSKGKICLLKVKESNAAKAKATTIGVLGTSARKWVVNGKLIEAAVFSDLVVTPAYRTTKPVLELIRKSVDLVRRQDICAIAFPNRLAAVATRRAGFKSVGEFARYAKVLRTGTKLAERLPVIIKASVAVLMDLALLVDDWTVARLSRHACLGTVGWNTDFDTRFDELTSNSSMGDIYCHRSGDFLRWRFLHGPRNDHRIFTVNLKDDPTKLAGYAVCHVCDGIAHIEDFFARDGEGIARAVFSRLVLELRTLPVNTVSMEVLARDSFMTFIERLRFQKRESRQLFGTVAGENTDGTDFEDDRFYITSLDEDQ